MTKLPRHFYEFGPFRIDEHERVLYREGAPVPLPPKIFDTLLALVEQSGHVVEKKELIQKVWPDTFVEENNLSQYISILRKTLGDERHEQRFIETIPKRGYRFAAEVREHSDDNVGQIISATQTRMSLVIKEEQEEEQTETKLVGGSSPALVAHKESGLAPLIGSDQTRTIRLRRILLPALIGAAVIASVLVAWRIFRQPEKQLAFNEREWVLITNFENRTGEPLFDGTIEHALERELSNSRFVNVVPRARVEDALRLMTKPPDSRIDAVLGREICLRDGGIRILLTGRTEKFGPTYVLSVGLIDPSTARTAVTASEEAAGHEQVWPAVRRLSAWVREKLGEELANIQQNSAELPKLTTPSLRALHLMKLAESPEYRGKQREGSLQLLREAIKEDPNFAHGHFLLAYHLRSRGAPAEEWQPLAQRALELSEHVSERERYQIKGHYYRMTGQIDRALPIFEAFARLYPDDFTARQELGNTYWMLGRWSEAREQVIAAAQLRPKDYFVNEWAAQLLLENARNIEAARPYVQRARELSAQVAHPNNRLWIEGFRIFDLWLDGQLDSAVKQFRETVQKDNSEILERGARDGFAQFAGNVHLLFGQLRAAEEAYRQITNERLKHQHLAYVAFAREDNASVRSHVLQYLREPSPRPSADSMSLLIRAGLFAEAGKLLSLWQLDVKRGFPDAYRYNGPYPFRSTSVFAEYLKNLQGELALARGETARAVAPLTEGTDRLRTMGEGIFLPASESLANAYQRQGDTSNLLRVLKEAAEAKPLLYRPVLEPVVIYWQRNQLRLAQLYRTAGRMEEARKIEEELLARLAYADADHPILLQLKDAENLAVNRPLR